MTEKNAGISIQSIAAHIQAVIEPIQRHVFVLSLAVDDIPRAYQDIASTPTVFFCLCLILHWSLYSYTGQWTPPGIRKIHNQSCWKASSSFFSFVTIGYNDCDLPSIEWTLSGARRLARGPTATCDYNIPLSHYQLIVRGDRFSGIFLPIRPYSNAYRISNNVCSRRKWLSIISALMCKFQWCPFDKRRKKKPKIGAF